MDSNSPCKDLLFPHGPNLAQTPLYLVGTVLNVKFLNKKTREIGQTLLRFYYLDYFVKIYLEYGLGSEGLRLSFTVQRMRKLLREKNLLCQFLTY